MQNKWIMSSPDIFCEIAEVDVDFYRKFYVDTQGLSDKDTTAHFVHVGFGEGRFPSAEVMLSRLELDTFKLPKDFDPKRYIELNHDLAFIHSDWQAKVRYLIKGKISGMQYKSMAQIAVEQIESFDATFYRRYYDDATHLSDADALTHFSGIGIQQGRAGNLKSLIRQIEDDTKYLPEDFSPEDYLRANPDLKPHLRREWEPAYHFLKYGRYEGRSYKPQVKIYDHNRLNVELQQIENPVTIIVDPERKPTINVLVPAFDFSSMSAGFFGVFQVALFIETLGYNVRLVMFDAFQFNADEMRLNLRNYPGLELLLDRVDVIYVGDRRQPLRVHPNDGCVATVWYSAYLARHISQYLETKKFLYLIQDYETVFHAAGSLYALADVTYSFDFHALFSSSSLQSFFVRNSIGSFADRKPIYTFFNNACARSISNLDSFLAGKKANRKKKLVFYSRPTVNRNMFELGALVLCTAFRYGVFDPDEWEFFGIGLGEAVIKLDDRHELKQLPRMTLAEYRTLISDFDVGLCLMASSHPSLLPFDLAGSGAVVVTNRFGTKDQSYFDDLVKGVVVCDLTVTALVHGLRVAAASSKDLQDRHKNALSMKYPTSWSDTFTYVHEDFVRQVFSATPRYVGQ